MDNAIIKKSHDIQFAEVCNAVNCISKSDVEVELRAGEKKFRISVCNNCLGKFAEGNHI